MDRPQSIGVALTILGEGSLKKVPSMWTKNSEVFSQWDNNDLKNTSYKFQEKNAFLIFLEESKMKDELKQWQ